MAMESELKPEFESIGVDRLDRESESGMGSVKFCQVRLQSEVADHILSTDNNDDLIIYSTAKMEYRCLWEKTSATIGTYVTFKCSGVPSYSTNKGYQETIMIVLTVKLKQSPPTTFNKIINKTQPAGSEVCTPANGYRTVVASI